MDQYSTKKQMFEQKNQGLEPKKYQYSTKQKNNIWTKKKQMFQQTKQLLKIVKKTIEVMFDQRKFVGTKINSKVWAKTTTKI